MKLNYDQTKRRVQCWYTWHDETACKHSKRPNKAHTCKNVIVVDVKDDNNGRVKPNFNSCKTHVCIEGDSRC